VTNLGARVHQTVWDVNTGPLPRFVQKEGKDIVS
jgi:hypothetical protein